MDYQMEIYITDFWKVMTYGIIGRAITRQLRDLDSSPHCAIPPANIKSFAKSLNLSRL